MANKSLSPAALARRGRVACEPIGRRQLVRSAPQENSGGLEPGPIPMAAHCRFAARISLYRPQSADRYFRAKAQDFRKLDKFDDVDPPLAAFEPRHEGLILAQLFGECGLREPCRLPLPNEKVHQRLVARRSKRFGQLRPAAADAGSSNNLKSRLS